MLAMGEASNIVASCSPFNGPVFLPALTVLGIWKDG